LRSKNDKLIGALTESNAEVGFGGAGLSSMLVPKPTVPSPIDPSPERVNARRDRLGCVCGYQFRR
ncbi:MAG: hypothetical protein ACK53V_18840, partial [Planctomycetota bacterium]